MTFTIKQGDTAPALRATLKRGDGAVVDLTAAEKVQFLLEDESENVLVDDDLSGNVSLVNAPQGVVQYSWKDGETDSTGQKNGEFIVVFESGKKETFPNRNYIYITIEDRIK
jgi:hypothetical protein